ncbi:DUF805 domain-containing protein [Aurantiacibacter luteus]|nr:DUF805 domain-containing protein [Aurantiacibacter luteus]
MANRPGKRIGRSRYWLLFLIYSVACVILMVGAGAALLSGDWVKGGIAVVLVLPLGVWFRVIMMRRCRDIGWAPSLPWLLMGASVVAGVATFATSGAAQANTLGASGLATLVYLGDFVFTLVIGAIRSRGGAGEDYAAVFSDDDVDFDPHGAGADAAIARALEDFRRTARPARPRPASALPRSGGFGRKVV